MRNKLSVGDFAKMSQLVKGQRGRVLSLHNDNPALRRRLLDMGITRGVTFEIKKVSPMGDPVDILLRGYELCVRLSEMENIEVELI
jgi:Fe2+ transport system protein FeoA